MMHFMTRRKRFYGKILSSLLIAVLLITLFPATVNAGELGEAEAITAEAADEPSGESEEPKTADEPVTESVTETEEPETAIESVTESVGEPQEPEAEATLAPLSGEPSEAFLSFSISGVEGVSDGYATITVTLSPKDVFPALKPVFTVPEGAVVKVGDEVQTSGVSEQDFRGDYVLYTVTIHGVDYEVSVFVNARASEAFLSFSINGVAGEAYDFLDDGSVSVMNLSSLSAGAQSGKRANMYVHLPLGTDITGLKPVFTVPEGAIVKVDGEVQESGISAQDFSGNVLYTVTINGTDYRVLVYVELPPLDEAFQRFSINGSEGVSNGSSITVPLPLGTDITGLKPVFTVPKGAIVKVDGEVQESGVSAQDFSGRYVLYTVTFNGVDYRVLVYVELLPPYKAFLSFSINGSEGMSNRYDTITVPLPLGTDITGLKPVFTVPEGAIVKVDGEVQESGVSAQNFRGGGVRYTVTIHGVDYEIWVVAQLPDTGNANEYHGLVQDLSGNPIAGAAIYWDGVDWAETAADGSFSFDFDNTWRWESYGFAVNKEGYLPGSFTLRPHVRFGDSIDLGVIRLAPITSGTLHGGVTAMPNYTQRGRAIQARVAYTSTNTLSGAVLTVSLPEGVSFTSGSQSDPTSVIGNGGRTLTLTGDLQAGIQKLLTVSLKADENFTGRGFEITATLNGTPLLPASVVLSHITLEIPHEIGFDADGSGASEKFTISGQASGLAGYKVGVEIRSADGELCYSKSNIPLEALTPWWKTAGAQIPGAKTRATNLYFVTATLYDNYGSPIESATDAMLVREKPLRMVDLAISTDRVTNRVALPASNSSYVAATVFVDGNHRGIDTIDISSEWETGGDVVAYEYTMSTNEGVFRGTDSAESDLTMGKFGARFNTGAYHGFGPAKIYLTLTRKDGSKQTFTVAHLTLLMDPSGRVYDKATKDPIAGATATLQIKSGGAWVDWDAETYDQSNPQLTGADGSYGWFVPEGEYRVLISKEGYADGDSTKDYGAIIVGPAYTDVDFYLTAITVPTVKPVPKIDQLDYQLEYSAGNTNNTGGTGNNGTSETEISELAVPESNAPTVDQDGKAIESAASPLANGDKKDSGFPGWIIGIAVALAAAILWGITARKRLRGNKKAA